MAFNDKAFNYGTSGILLIGLLLNVVQGSVASIARGM